MVSVLTSWTVVIGEKHQYWSKHQNAWIHCNDHVSVFFAITSWWWLVIWIGSWVIVEINFKFETIFLGQQHLILTISLTVNPTALTWATSFNAEKLSLVPPTRFFAARVVKCNFPNIAKQICPKRKMIWFSKLSLDPPTSFFAPHVVKCNFLYCKVYLSKAQNLFVKTEPDARVM